MLSADLQLLADIETRSRPSDPIGYWELGDQAVFLADDGGGYDLYISDGTEAGTQAIQQFNGTAASGPAVAAGDLLFFQYASQLWRTDGTEAGTFSLSADLPDPTLKPERLIAVGTNVFFTADDGDASNPTPHGRELWKSDGTVVGTSLVADLTPGPSSSELADFTAVGDRLVFEFDKDQLWVSDGTESGTVLIREFTQTNRSDLLPTVALGANAFLARNAEIWKIDPQAGVAELALDFAPFGTIYIPGYQVVDDRLWFTAARQLWVWDGVSSAAEPLITIDTNIIYNMSYNEAPFGLYFTATIQGGTGTWVSDGTASGTHRLSNGSSDPGADRIAFGEHMYYYRSQFDPTTGATTRGLMRTNGQSAVADFFLETTSFSGGSLAVAGDRLFYLDAFKLWSTDGTVEGTYAVPGGPTTQIPLSVVGEQLFFTTSSASFGREPWRADASGANQLRDVRTETRSSDPQSLTAAGGQLYFRVELNNDYYRPLYTADQDGARVVTSLVVTERAVRGMVEHEGVIYLAAKQIGDSLGEELWRIGPEGAELVIDQAPGTTSSQPDWLTSAGDWLYFSSRGEIGGTLVEDALWRTDGTVTELVWYTTSVFFRTANTIAVEGAIYFSSSGDIYRSDIATNVTTLVKRLPWFHQLDNFTAFEGRLYFLANINGMGSELWTSDGTEAGTVPVTNFPGNLQIATLNSLTVAGGELYFAGGSHPSDGHQVYRYDGPELGAVDVTQFGPSQALGSPTNLASVAGVLYFSATDPEHGRELWKLDPATGQPVIVADINPGPASSNPRDITVVDGRLYVVATTPEYGEEVWVADIAPPGDFNRDLVVDAADYTVWRDRQGSAEEYQLWRDNFGKVGGLDPLPAPAVVGAAIDSAPSDTLNAATLLHASDDDVTDQADPTVWLDQAGAPHAARDQGLLLLALVADADDDDGVVELLSIAETPLEAAGPGTLDEAFSGIGADWQNARS